MPKLEQELVTRGYQEDAPTLVQAADVASMSAVAMIPAWQVEAGDTPTSDWWAVHGTVDPGTVRGVRDPQGLYAAMLLAPQVDMVFVTAYLHGSPGAIGQGLAQGDWLGIQSMRTLPDYRRRGGAQAVLATIAVWGNRHGCDHAYLGVMRENIGARALYARAGFGTVGSYRYLVSSA